MQTLPPQQRGAAQRRRAAGYTRSVLRAQTRLLPRWSSVFHSALSHPKSSYSEGRKGGFLRAWGGTKNAQYIKKIKVLTFKFPPLFFAHLLSFSVHPLPIQRPMKMWRGGLAWVFARPTRPLFTHARVRGACVSRSICRFPSAASTWRSQENMKCAPDSSRIRSAFYFLSSQAIPPRLHIHVWHDCCRNTSGSYSNCRLDLQFPRSAEIKNIKTRAKVATARHTQILPLEYWIYFSECATVRRQGPRVSYPADSLCCCRQHRCLFASAWKKKWLHMLFWAKSVDTAGMRSHIKQGNGTEAALLSGFITSWDSSTLYGVEGWVETKFLKRNQLLCSILNLFVQL